MSTYECALKLVTEEAMQSFSKAKRQEVTENKETATIYCRHCGATYYGLINKDRMSIIQAACECDILR